MILSCLFYWVQEAQLGGYLISQAHRHAESGLAAPFEYIALPLAMFWGLVIFDESPSSLTLVGSGFILASGLYTLYRETHHYRLPNMTNANEH